MLTTLPLPNASWFPSVRVVRGIALALFVASLVGLTGCGGSRGSKNSVSGKVTLGTEQVSGIVSFVGTDNKEVASPIKADGTYSIDDPPTGTVKILVKGMGMPGGATGAPPLTPPKDAPTMPTMPGTTKGAAPPAKYASAATTDLTYEVKPGKHTYNIELKP